MTVTEAMDWGITEVEHLTEDDSTDPDLRAKWLYYLIEVFRDIWYEKEWPFKLRTDQVTVAASECSVVVPSDFSDFGFKGGVWRNSDHYKLEGPLDEQYIRQLQLQQSPSGSPTVFSVFGQNTSSPFLPMFQTTYVNDDTVFDLLYQAQAPTLDESTYVDNTNRIPPAYHETALKAGLRAIAGYGHGDARKRDFTTDPMFVLAKRKMAEVLLRKMEPPQLPNFFDR